MALDFNNHSFWLSRLPTNTTQTGGNWSYTLPPENSFFYLGGSLSFSYSNTYSASITGIPTDADDGLTRTPEDAYFVDSGSGSISTISINCIRAQPREPVEPSPLNNNNYNQCSNATVQKTLRAMKNAMQLSQGAYILRIYNATQNPRTFGQPFDIPVCIDSYNVSTTQDRPFELNISLQLTKRSPLNGITVGTTYYGAEDNA